MYPDIYIEELEEELPRLLGLLDRDPGSATYGCLDRDYWNNKVIDFPCARKQEAALTLALLAREGRRERKTREKQGRRHLERWSRAAIGYWARIQRPDGTFDEWYPREKSFVATAFSTYAIAQALRELGDAPSAPIADALRKAARWLAGRKEIRAANQSAGAMAALHLVGVVLGEKRWLAEARKMRDLVLSLQDREGWWPEYGGADVGYASLALDYLVKYAVTASDDKALAAAKRAASFLGDVSPDGMVPGGEIGSRNTEYLIPHGIEVLAKSHPDASRLALLSRRLAAQGIGVGPRSLDDRYLCYIGYTWAQASRDGSKRLVAPSRKSGLVRYMRAGVLAWHGDRAGFVINTRKASVRARVGNKVLFDGGVLVSQKERWWRSGFQGALPKVTLSTGGVVIEGFLYKQCVPRLTPSRLVALRTAMPALPAAQWIKERLRDALVSAGKKGRIRFRRELRWSEEEVGVIDEINAKEKMDKVALGHRSSSAYTPSARFFAGPIEAEAPIWIECPGMRVKVTRRLSERGVRHEINDA